MLATTLHTGSAGLFTAIFDPTGTSFVEIDRYMPLWRGGPTIRGISQMEMRWIYEFKSCTPFGINVDWDINAFIKNS